MAGIWPTYMSCFWCRRSFPSHMITRDHIKPACMGGSKRPPNIVHACPDCQGERGQITGLWGMQLSLARLIAAWPTLAPSRRSRARKLRRAIIRRLPQVLKLKERWVKLERQLLDFSPTSLIEFRVPVLPEG
jgi:hypothetical protein